MSATDTRSKPCSRNSEMAAADTASCVRCRLRSRRPIIRLYRSDTRIKSLPSYTILPMSSSRHAERDRLDHDFADKLVFLARARRALAWMLEHARMRVATGEQVAGDRYTAERLGRMLK